MIEAERVGVDAAAADEPAVSLGGALAAASRSTER